MLNPGYGTKRRDLPLSLGSLGKHLLIAGQGLLIAFLLKLILLTA